MNVYEKLVNIQNKLKAPKNQYNSFGKYNYRSCEDILEGLKPLLNELKAIVTLSDEMVHIEGRFYIKAIATFIDAEKGEKIEVSALAREDETKKGMDLAQVTGSVSSYARKYALNGLFCIDDTKDSDSTNTHGKADTSDKGNKGTNASTDNPKSSNDSSERSEAQIKRLFAIAQKAGYLAAQVKSASIKKFNKSELSKLTKQEYDTMCKGYEGVSK
jgi:hypothetical protein